MTWKMAGTYVATCSCELICPCPVDGKPTGPNNECLGSAVFHIANGQSDGVDLSGVDVALYNLFPSNLTAGNWKMGVVLDAGASDDQAKEIEKIFSGKAGGPFAEFVPLIGEFLGIERAPITFKAGKKPSATIGKLSKYEVDPITGPDGGTVTVKDAPFGFAPEYTIGKANGTSKDAFGMSFVPVYGEYAEFEYADKMGADVPHGRA
jgi:hypothetical protein